MKPFVFFNQAIPESHIQQYEIGIIEFAEYDSYHIRLITQELIVIFYIEQNVVTLFDPTQTGDAYDYKVCNVCHRRLPTANSFQRNQNGVNNRPVRRPSCNDCRSHIDGAKISIQQRRLWQAQKPPSYEPFQCPICEKVTIPELTSKIVLDHNHLTGAVRGWICDSCNTGIGRFKDDVGLLRRAIHFLETK